MTEAAKLQILIDIKTQLAELEKANAEFRRTQNEVKAASEGVSGFFAQFRQGLGIGAGMFTIERAVAAVKNTLVQTAREAVRLAGEIRDGSEALGFSVESYQVFAFELSKANVDMSRLSMAVGSQTMSLAQLRNGATEATQAYRTLGLSAAALEAMSPDERVLAVARATLAATDQTKAFQAAGAILGSRGLPQLLSGLRDLAGNYDKVAAAAKSAGVVMSEDTAARLDRAQKEIERLKRRFTIETGETIALPGKILDGLKRQLGGTLGALLTVNVPFAGMSMLRATLDSLLSTGRPQASTRNDAAAAREEALREELKQLQVDLAATQQWGSTAAENGMLSDAERSKVKLAALNAEVEVRRKIVETVERLSEFDNSTPERTAELIKLQGEAQRAANALATALGQSPEFVAARHEMQIALSEQGAAFLQAINPLRTETETRGMLLPILKDQIASYQALADIRFPDAADLLAKQKLGTITPDELERLKEWVALRVQLNAVVAQVKGIEEFPVPADEQVRQRRDLRQRRAGMTNYERSIDDARNVSNPAENPDYLSTGQGVMAGFSNWATQAGSIGQQVAGTLTGTIGGAVNTLSAGIMGLITKTKSLGDVGREMGLMFVQALVQMVVQALAFASVMGVISMLTGGTFGGGFMGAFTGRASGGPVSAGQPYIVGERRPEVFVPSVSGTIIPSIDQYNVMTAGRYAGGGYSPGARGSAIQASAARPQRTIVIVKSLNDAQEIARDPNFDSVVVDTVRRNRGDILEGLA